MARSDTDMALLTSEPASAMDRRHETETGWRDDLRLFAVTWAIGFLFFLILFA